MLIPAPLVREYHRLAIETIARACAEPERLDAGAAHDTVLLAQKLNRIDLVLPSRDALAAALRAGQDPATGNFARAQWHVPLVPILERGTALHSLGATFEHPVRDLERIVESDASLLQWLDALDWAWPWGGPTGAGHSLISLTYSAADLGFISQAQLEIIRAAIETHRDETYGVWSRGHFTRPELKQLGGAFAMGIVYARFRWPLSRPEGVVRLLEEMQLAIGSWMSEWPSRSTDMDAAWLLDRCTRRDASLRPRALAMLERLARYHALKLADPVEGPKQALGSTINLLAVLRTVFPDPADDTPPWVFVMYGAAL